MKKIHVLTLSMLMFALSLATNAEKPSATTILGISISFSTHAYWDGTTKSCMPRPKGWCLHFEIDAINPVGDGTIRGEISNEPSTGLMLKFNKRSGVTKETFSRYFNNGKFNLDGTGTIADELIKKLGLTASYSIPVGEYNYKESGDVVIISFRSK